MTGAEQRGNDLQRFFETANAMVVGEAKGAVLRFVPTGAESEDHTAATDFVDRGRHLGDQGRIAETRCTPPADRSQSSSSKPLLPPAATRHPRRLARGRAQSERANDRAARTNRSRTLRPEAPRRRYPPIAGRVRSSGCSKVRTGASLEWPTAKAHRYGSSHCSFAARRRRRAA